MSEVDKLDKLIGKSKAKDEFIKEYADMQSQVDILLKKMIDLKRSYMTENAEFKMGDKVMVTNSAMKGKIDGINIDVPATKTYGFVDFIHTSRNGKISYRLLKMKANHTPSKNELHYSPVCKMELAND